MAPLLLLAASLVHAGTIHVPGDHATIQAAVSAASSGDEILVAPGHYAESVVINGKDLVIVGLGGPAGVTFEATGASGFLDVRGGADVSVRGASFDGVAAWPAATVSGVSTLELDRVWVSDTANTTNGGAVHLSGAGAALWVRDARFADSVTTGTGGFLFAGPGTELHVVRSLFRDGSASGGAAIHCKDASVCDVEESIFRNNSATWDGGALLVNDSGAEIRRSLFCENTGNNGGAIVAMTGQLDIRNNLFVDNSATADGGALFASASTLVGQNNSFVGNTADDGAALYALGGAYTGVNELFTHQNASSSDTVHITGGTHAITWSLFAANTGGNANVAVGNGTQQVGNAGLVGYSPGDCDAATLLLAAGSPAIDAGAPQILDPDGSRSDIGASGGPDALADADADGHVSGFGDCNDGNAGIHPGATETAGDGVDSDCDGLEACWLDDDGDGYGSTTPMGSVDLSCSSYGTSTNDLDCDDTDPAIHPGATEIPVDGIDQDCDGEELCYFDGDGDGFGDPLQGSSDLTCSTGSLATVGGDCNDADGSVHPGATEIPADGIDQDCNGEELCYLDGDHDGYGTPTQVPSPDLSCTAAGVAPTPDDCDDAVASVHPGAPEIVANQRDDNCDGLEVCYVDLDHDGYGSSQTTTSSSLTCSVPGVAPNDDDCDDTQSARNPGATEIPANGIDEDCDNQELCYLDADHDGYGSTTLIPSASLTCSVTGVSTLSTDCDDTAPGRNPGATEICGNGIDEDCDGIGHGPQADDDGDGLTFAQESAIGSSDCSIDSDADGVPDAIEYHIGDTDGDDIPNILDPDDDGDGIPTLIEGTGNQEDQAPCPWVVWDDIPNYLDLDSDGDQIPDAIEGEGDDDGDNLPNYLDCDDSDGCTGDPDGDGLNNCEEADIGTNPGLADSDGDGVDDLTEVGDLLNPTDTDGDGIIDALDPDDDGDLIPTALEDHDGDGDPTNDDSDGDQIPDYLDDDDDNDGVLTRDEDRDGDGDPTNDDTDGDGIGDWLDPDDFDGPLGDADGDGIGRADEEALGLDPWRDDSDGDGLSDGFELGSVDAPRDSDGDGVIDALDPDDDGDGIPTAIEGLLDPDGDGIPAYLDEDSDGDGRPDAEEGMGDDDCDGIPNWLDPNDADGSCEPAEPDRITFEEGSCGGCSSSGSGATGWALFALIPLVLRRRRNRAA